MNYLVTGKGLFNKEQLIQQLFQWSYEKPEDIIAQIEKQGSVKLDNKKKICKFR